MRRGDAGASPSNGDTSGPERRPRTDVKRGWRSGDNQRVFDSIDERLGITLRRSALVTSLHVAEVVELLQRHAELRQHGGGGRDMRADSGFGERRQDVVGCDSYLVVAE